MKTRRMLTAVFALVVLLSALTTWHASGNLLDADAASELVLAKHLNDTGRILSADWYYSTELRVLNTQLVYAPLFSLFDSWRMVRFCGAMILQGLLLASYGYFVKKARMGRNAFFLGGALLLCPAGIAYGRVALYHCYYAPHIALGFWIAGSFLAAACAKAGWMRLLRLGELGLIALLSGLGGIRQGVITVIPLAMVAGLRMIQKQREGQRIPALLKGCSPEIAAAAAACAGFGVGYMVNSKILSQIFSFSSFDSVRTAMMGAEKLDDLAYGFLHQFGFRWKVKAISPMGLLSMAGLAAGLASAGESIHALRPGGSESLGAFTARRFFPACVTVMLCVFLFTDSPDYYPLYMVPMGVWAVPMLTEGLKRAKMPVRRLVLGLAAAAMLASGLGNMGFVFSPARFSQPYEGLFWQDARTVKKIRGAVDFLNENGCRLGYADSWTANLITELTDGEIRMVPLVLSGEGNRIDYNDWLTVKSLRDEPMDAPFVVMRAPAAEACMNARGSEYMEAVYADDYYTVYRVTDDANFRQILSE